MQDQHPLSLNRDRDHLQKYWAIIKCITFPVPFSLHSGQKTFPHKGKLLKPKVKEEIWAIENRSWGIWDLKTSLKLNWTSFYIIFNKLKKSLKIFKKLVLILIENNRPKFGHFLASIFLFKSKSPSTKYSCQVWSDYLQQEK